MVARTEPLLWMAQDYLPFVITAINKPYIVVDNVIHYCFILMLGLCYSHVYRQVAIKEGRGIGGCRKKDVIVEIDEMLSQALYAVHVQFQGMAAETRLRIFWQDVAVFDNM